MPAIGAPVPATDTPVPTTDAPVPASGAPVQIRQAARTGWELRCEQALPRRHDLDRSKLSRSSPAPGRNRTIAGWSAPTVRLMCCSDRTIAGPSALRVIGSTGPPVKSQRPEARRPWRSICSTVATCAPQVPAACARARLRPQRPRSMQRGSTPPKSTSASGTGTVCGRSWTTGRWAHQPVRAWTRQKE